jgi:DNA-binding NtrC family response regulator
MSEFAAASSLNRTERPIPPASPENGLRVVGIEELEPTGSGFADVSHAKDNGLKSGKTKLVHQSREMLELVRKAQRFAKSSASVLITGESGVGKELFSQIIHEHSSRVQSPYICVNCAALPEALVESELFGHERGAFTGASESRTGWFELANRGTILLDEISETPTTVQAKLLRFLELQQFHRVGGKSILSADVRVVATSNRDLEIASRKKRFREDLYHRLNVLRLHIPPLRERRQDIPYLVQYFVDRFRSEALVPIHTVSKDAMQILTKHDWPGNVRELRNVVHHACIMTDKSEIQPSALPPLSMPRITSGNRLLNSTLAEVERQVIMASLRRNNGNKTAAALQLGVTARTLRNKMHEYKSLESPSATDNADADPS